MVRARSSDSLDSEVSSRKSREDGLECPVCWEVFNDGENLPYVLWCGHTLCKSCVMGLQWAVVKFPVVPVQLPLFITCPWCQSLSCRLVWKGKLKYPCKNYFLLWMVESSRGDGMKHSRESVTTEQRTSGGGNRVISQVLASEYQGNRHRYECFDQSYLHSGQGLASSDNRRLQQRSDLFSLRVWFYRLMAFCVQVTAKLAFSFLLLFILLYVLPFSTVVLVVYIMATLIFAFPSLLMVYFAFPSLSWLVREIVT